MDSGSGSSSGFGGGPGCYSGQGDCSPTIVGSCPVDYACDFNATAQQFVCFPPPNVAGLGKACDNTHGPFCAHGLHCQPGVTGASTGTCASYCCDDEQCSGKTCTATQTVGTTTLHLCL